MPLENSQKNTFFIAELSANHGGKLDIAIETLRAAKAAGADAIKLQTYTADTMTLNSARAEFKIQHGTIWDGRSFYDLYQEASTPWEWHKPLQEEAHKLGLVFFSTPFDKTAVDFLETLNVPAYKIASFEITDIPLIEYAASKAKPMIISTGIATLSEIEDAVKACHKMGNFDVTLLKCTSAYPAPIEEANIRTIPHLAELFKTKVGLSDHTAGHAVAVAAVCLGATMVEKHFILDPSVGGPDASFSMTPSEFKTMVDVCRQAELALGQICYNPTPKAISSRVFSRSLYATQDIPAGSIFTEENIKSLRPGGGLSPKYTPDFLGQTASQNIERGSALNWSFIQPKAE